MFKVTKGDYEFIFEYDTIEELMVGKEIAEQDYQNYLRENKNRFEYLHEVIEKTKNEPSNDKEEESLTFEELEIKFIASKKKSEKVGASTYKAYATAFDKAKKYFKEQPVRNLTIHNFEAHQEYLVGKLKNKTINNHMAYISMFMDYAKKYKYVDDNYCKDIETLKVDYMQKSNFTDDEITRILEANMPAERGDCYKALFEIAVFSGMRVSEIISLKPENICERDGIAYFNVVESKTHAGIREIPIHHSLLGISPDLFPLLGDRTVSAGQKGAMRILYSIIDEELGKTFHTFRGTAISKMSNAYPEKIHLIQEIVGHSKGDKSITLDTYAKGFDLSLKKGIIDSIDYSH